MRNIVLLGKGDSGASGNPRISEECTRKTFSLYIQSWLARESIAKVAQTTDEDSAELKDRESYLLKIKEMLFDIRKCEIYPMVIGYRETIRWFGDKMTFVIHGNTGCEIRFRRFIDLSQTGREVARKEEDYRQLERMFGR